MMTKMKVGIYSWDNQNPNLDKVRRKKCKREEEISSYWYHDIWSIVAISKLPPSFKMTLTSVLINGNRHSIWGDAADNMDLYVIVNEFETYYQMKFDKPPKLVKKLEGGEQSDKRLPKLNNA